MIASGLTSAERATQISFGSADLSTIPAEDILNAFSSPQKYSIAKDQLEGTGLLTVAVSSGLVKSKCKLCDMLE